MRLIISHPISRKHHSQGEPGGLCPSCKIQQGGLCPSCKIHGGDFVHVYKNEQGGFCPGGILSYTR